MTRHFLLVSSITVALAGFTAQASEKVLLPQMQSGDRSAPSQDAPRVAGGSPLASAWAAETLRDLTLSGLGTVPDGAAPPPLRDRGGPDWVRVYENAAPSVVFLGGATGFGSGFLVSRDGWVVTNHHVARAAVLDDERHWVMNAYFGELKENGAMAPIEKPLRAVVHRWNAPRDLAILKLDTNAPHLDQVKPLELVQPGGSGTPRSGGDIALVGNAAIGLLWAMKTGHISSIGTLATSMPELVSRWNQVLGINPSSGHPSGNLRQIEEELAEAFKSWIGGRTLLIQATAETSPGDSGGPLLNERGEVVGVAMGLRAQPETGTSISYYIHVDELRPLLSDLPSKAMVELPRDIWSSSATNYDLADLSGDGVADVLRGFDAQGQPVLVAVDVDQSTNFEGVFTQQRASSAVVGVFRVGSGQLVVYQDGAVVRSDEAKHSIWQAQLPARVGCADLTADGNSLVVGGMDGSLLAVAITDGKLSWRSSIDGSPVSAITAGGEKHIWAGTYQGTLAKVQPTGVLDRSLSVPNPIVDVACSKSGELVAIAEYNGPLRGYETGSLAPLWTNAELTGYSLRFDRDDATIVLSPQDDAHRLYWIAGQTGELQRELAVANAPYAFELNEKGDKILVHHHDADKYVVYDATQGTIIAEWETPRTEAEMLLSSNGPRPPVKRFVYDGARLISGTIAGSLYDVELESKAVRAFTHEVLMASLDRLANDRAFDAEFAWLSDPLVDSAYALYDLSGDGAPDLVRVDDRQDDTLDAEYSVVGSDAERIRSAENEPLFAPEERVPADWVRLYSLFRGVGK